MLVKKLFIYVPFITSLIQVGQCHRTAQRNRDNRWPVVYTNDQAKTISYDPTQPVDIYIDLIKDGIFMAPNETSLLPSSDVVYTYDETSPIAKELMFVSALCKTTNCRESLDVWDCPTCSEVLPDAVVVRTFKTFPNDITGQILRSDNMTTFFIQVRGANSNSNRILWSKQNLVDHPFIPDVRVQEGYLESALDIREIIRNTMKDQLTIYPNYKVAVVGHSFGAGVCSLVATHLQYDFPQLNRNNFKTYLLAKPRVGDYNYAKYIADKDIEIVRLVNALDEMPHKPSILDGYVHEGDEYWLKYYNNGELLLKVCPGPFETRNCSNSSPYFSAFEHSEAFGIQEACFPDDALHLNFTALIEKLSNETISQISNSNN